VNCSEAQIRRIGKDHVGQLFTQQSIVAVDHGGIPAQYFVISANPDITRNIDWIFRHFGRGIFIGQTARGIGIIQEQIIKLFGIKSQQIYVEIQIFQRR